MEYRVKWEIDVAASSPEEAVRIASRMFPHPSLPANQQGTATVFEVTERPADKKIKPTTFTVDNANETCTVN